MGFNAELHDNDVVAVEGWMRSRPDTASVAKFKPGPGIQRLEMTFDIGKLKAALVECLDCDAFQGDMQIKGLPHCL